MRDFREIRKLELQSKELKENLENKGQGAEGGALSGINDKLEGFINEQLEDGEGGYF